MDDLQFISIFYIVDNFYKDFLQEFERKLIGENGGKRTDCLAILEIIMILLWFNMSGMKDFGHLVHTKYRSVTGFFLNVLSSIACYQCNSKKPQIGINRLNA